MRIRAPPRTLISPAFGSSDRPRCIGPRRRRGPHRIPADFLDRPPDRRRIAAGLHRRAREGVRDRHPGRRDPGRLLGVSRAARSRWPPDLPRAATRSASSSTACSHSCLPRVLGLLFSKIIKRHLFAPVPVALAFIVGALVILWVERRQRVAPSTVRIDRVDAMRWTRRAQDRLRAGVRPDARHVALRRDDHRRHAVRAVATGCHRVLVLPRHSDAARRLRLRARAQSRPAVDRRPAGVRRSGFVAAFVSAFFCVRWLIRYVSRHDFVPFAWYRIAFGLLILFTAWSGSVRWD